MSFLYPRTVQIRRLKTEAVLSASENSAPEGIQQVGLLGYSGAQQSTSPEDINGELVLFKNISCNIEAQQAGRTKDGYLPSDVTQKPLWLIIIPQSQLPQYSVRDRDIVVDDEGYRYNVASNWWTGMAYDLTCVRMEA
jgi:hypothetical protein